MGYYKDNKASGGGGRNSRGTTYGVNRDGMHKTTCSNCGKECEVPFRPTGEKPVYCSDCFRKMGPGDAPKGNDRGPRRPSFGNRDGGHRGDRGSRPSAQPNYTEQFNTLNAKLDTLIELLKDTKTKKEPKRNFTPLSEDTE